MGRVKTPRRHLPANRVRVVGAVAVAVVVALGLSGCIDPNSQFATTPPVDDFVVETEPLPDDAVEEEVIVEDIVYANVEECLQGNWEINNEAFGEFFARTDERVVSITVSGLATMAIEGDSYRMFFEEWSIQYDTGDPTFLLARAGNETVQFSITPDGAMEFLEQDDQIVLEFFSIVDGGDGEAIAIATSEPGPLPLDGSTLQCTGASLEVFVEQESFFFDRR
jgi:hypothetical protein